MTTRMGPNNRSLLGPGQMQVSIINEWEEPTRNDAHPALAVQLARSYVVDCPGCAIATFSSRATAGKK